MNLVLRVLASVLAASLIIGELWRSWGAGRPLAFVLDDILIGSCLIVGAVLFRTVTMKRYGFFVGSWALAVGMLYGSFFNKLLSPATEQAGNWGMGLLTFLVGLAFMTSVVGFALSLALAPQTENRND
jgi:hypothetical protein